VQVVAIQVIGSGYRFRLSIRVTARGYRWQQWVNRSDRPLHNVEKFISYVVNLLAAGFANPSNSEEPITEAIQHRPDAELPTTRRYQNV